MKYLIVHQNFPAQFVHIVRHLAAQQKHDIVFVTENQRNQLQGVRKVLYSIGKPPNPATYVDAREFELATMRAHAVAQVCGNLAKLGFKPDVILGHHGWGELLNIGDVWPDVPMIGYHEFYYNVLGFDVNFDPEFPTAPDQHARIRAKNAINLLALTNPGYGHTPTRFQRATYPAWSRPGMAVLEEGVNLDVVKPNPAIRRRILPLAGYKIRPAEKLVTYVVRDLEPYRGFHVMMRAIPHILAGRPDVRVMLVGGDGVSYGAQPPAGTWRKRMLDELGDRLDLTRVHFAGRVPYETYVRIMQRSDTHVYLTYPFVASWSLREALATGCAVVASDTAPVREFVTHGQNGLLTPFHDPRALADTVLESLENKERATKLRAAARDWALRHLDMAAYLANYETLIDRAIARDWPAGEEPA